MGLLQVILVLVLIGVVLWAVQRYIPMDPVIKRIITIVVIVAVVIWLLSLFGLLPNLNAIRVGK